MINRLFCTGGILLLAMSYCFDQELVAGNTDTEILDKRIEANYFPPAESKGGWRKLEDPKEIRRLAGMDPARLESLKQWLLDSDDRPFAATVIRNG